VCQVEFEGTNEFDSTEYRTARKVHRCCECDEIIAPGQRYRYDVCKWDRQMSDWRTCLPCENLRDWLMQQMKDGKADETSYVDDCGAWIFEHLSIGIQEAFSDGKVPPAPPSFLDGHLRMFFEAHFDDVFNSEAPTYAAAAP
jgi:hypothetical protein